MEDIIQLLPDHVANQIAAGEVIQRPASVVKELLENAIDAKATEIKLVIKEAGKTLIQVTDNGIGMSATDARLAFERHATSKIRKAEDLFSLHTKGFRGEALASIAAIAQVEMITKRTNDELGTEIRNEGSKITYQEPYVSTKGTSIAVKNLFFNIPARRNFLKSDNVELRHVLDEFHRVALAHPEVHFYLYNNGNELFNLPSSDFRKRIVGIFGRKLDNGLVPVQEETNVMKISGYIVKPEFLRKSKQQQFFLVNKRFIRNRYLHHALSQAYEGLIKESIQPEYFLNLEVNPQTIDINIHPTKTEIKFENEHTIYSLLKSAVKHSLGQFNIMPTLDFTHDKDFDLPYSYKNKIPSFPKVEVDPTFNPFEMDKTPKEKSSTKSSLSYQKEKKASWESLYVGTNPDEVTSQINWEQPLTTLTIFEQSDEINEPKDRLTLLFGKKYIVTVWQGQILIINVKRAHQRVLYERYMKNIQRDHTASQQLLFPLEIQFSKSDISVLKELEEALNAIGFLFSIHEENVIITGIPLKVDENQIESILYELVSNHRENIPKDDFSQNDLFAKSLSTSLCVKSVQNMSREEQENLLQSLFACDDYTTSPFQKRIYTTFSLNDIDNQLK